MFLNLAPVLLNKWQLKNTGTVKKITAIIPLGNHAGFVCHHMTPAGTRFWIRKSIGESPMLQVEHRGIFFGGSSNFGPVFDLGSGIYVHTILPFLHRIPELASRPPGGHGE